MKTTQTTISKNVFDLDKKGQKQKVTLNNGREAIKMKKQDFKVEVLKFHNDLELIPKYPGKDSGNNFESASAKLSGNFTYLIPDKVKKSYSMKWSGRGDTGGYFISRAKNNIDELVEYLKSIKSTNGWIEKVIVEHPNSELAKQTGTPKKSTKVNGNDRELEQLKKQVEALTTLIETEN